MFHVRTGPRMSLRTTAGMGLLVAMAIGVGACGAGGASDGRPTAVGGATPATTNLAAASPTAPSSAGPVAAAVPAAPPIGATQAHRQDSTTPSKAVTAAPTAVSQAPKPTTPAPVVVTAPAPTTAALPARRTPSAAEVNQVIARVHAMIPLFTPTQAQIVKVGDQVCTAFDQGKTVAQIKATAMQMAGAYAALIPAGVADSAVRTIVTLFCPGYSSKLV
jgi:hypothetical protein